MGMKIFFNGQMPCLAKEFQTQSQILSLSLFLIHIGNQIFYAQIELISASKIFFFFFCHAAPNEEIPKFQSQGKWKHISINSCTIKQNISLKGTYQTRVPACLFASSINSRRNFVPKTLIVCCNSFSLNNFLRELRPSMSQFRVRRPPEPLGHGGFVPRCLGVLRPCVSAFTGHLPVAGVFFRWWYAIKFALKDPGSYFPASYGARAITATFPAAASYLIVYSFNGAKAQYHRRCTFSWPPTTITRPAAISNGNLFSDIKFAQRQHHQERRRRRTWTCVWAMR